MTKSQEIRQENCFSLIRKYQIHDAIVNEAADEGVSKITIWRRLSRNMFYYLNKETSVLGISSTVTRQGFRTEISVGIAR